MKLFVAVLIVVAGVCAGGTGDTSTKKDHNKDAHGVLCDVMKAAVGSWVSGGTTLTDPLKAALKKTIFGEGGHLEDVQSFRSKLPDVYGSVLEQRESRNFACGQSRNEEGDYSKVEQVRWSGHSAPHDMVCLCTAGSHGWPINRTGPATTLCGKDKETLKGSENKGWDSSGHDGKEQITATWFNVTSECLQSDEKKGEKLKDALNKFIKSLVPKPGEAHPSRKQLGEGDPNEQYACSGSSARGVCVMYYPKDRYATPWWIQLEQAIEKDEQIQKQRAKEEAESMRKEQAATQDESQIASSSSAPTINNQTEQPHKTNNFTDKLRKFNLTGSSSITPPSSWLLSAAFLI
ncbi:unnamed protein product [Trypanosoma congolense IL3000]|uniref:WGS project CAEQ00000000 data, annotated contig 1718 n=1 Tax=Trypanosoma congolense (strain IL3000) TaxID=1068625 RepID=F9W893_TRYCI|nr:unnamed protein product [Trypanosoma congolense IL3000]